MDHIQDTEIYESSIFKEVYSSEIARGATADDAYTEAYAAGLAALSEED